MNKGQLQRLQEAFESLSKYRMGDHVFGRLMDRLIEFSHDDLLETLSQPTDEHRALSDEIRLFMEEWDKYGLTVEANNSLKKLRSLVLPEDKPADWIELYDSGRRINGLEEMTFCGRTFKLKPGGIPYATHKSHYPDLTQWEIVE